MSVIVGVEDVLKTFSLEEQESARQYFTYEKLRAENPSWGYKRLAKALGVKIAERNKRENITSYNLCWLKK